MARITQQEINDAGVAMVYHGDLSGWDRVIAGIEAGEVMVTCTDDGIIVRAIPEEDVASGGKPTPEAPYGVVGSADPS